MQIYKYDITFSEVPDEICLTFSVAGCTLNCPDCFWNDFRNSETRKLTIELLRNLIKKYDNFVTCVCFLGGDWEKDLVSYLKEVQKLNKKTALYTGLEDVNEDIKQHLNYLKTGRYVKELGSLTCNSTNQKFYDLKNNREIRFYEK